MASFLDVCRFSATSIGTADFVPSAASVGYQGPISAGVVNGRTYRYRAESADLSQWEIGYGTFNTSTNTFARGTVLYNSSATGTGAGQTGAGTKINFTAVPQVGVVLLAEDIAALVANVVQRKFTTGTTYTPTAGLLFAIIECVGAGAGGGGTTANTHTFIGGGGGGGGGYSRGLLSAATIGASQTVTVGAGGTAGAAGGGTGGAGGDSSFGTLVVGKGGSAGTGGTSSVGGTGGPGGVAGTGDISIPGGSGDNGMFFLAATSGVNMYGFGGAGGSAGGGLGYGGVPPVAAYGSGAGSAVSGAAGQNYGGGGSGSISCDVAAGGAGGAGAVGVVIVTEFCGTV